MFFKISRWICIHDVFASGFFSFTCHDTVSYYDTSFTPLFINCHTTSDFYQHDMHDTTYDTLIVTSLRELDDAK
jgi:hypothetical protein